VRIFKKVLSGLIFTASMMTTSIVYSQYQCSQVVEKQGYQACYNYGLKATLLTKHRLNAADLKKKGFERDNMRFYEEKAIPRKYRATLADWRYSHGFDRSHLVPNGDMNHSRRLQKATFSLVCQGMHYANTNRVSLLAVENLIRRLTISNGKSVVWTGNIFASINPKRVGPGLVAVPTAVFKVIYFPSRNKKVAFLIPNIKKRQSSKASSFRVDPALIEKKSGFVFN
jgi:endonuclease G